LRGALAAAETDVRRNQQLIRLRDDLPVSADPAACAARPPDAGALAPLFARWGFKTMLRELEAAAPAQGALL
jgi:hypothetical protein